MATTVNITTTYAGKFESDQILLAALKEAITLQNGGISVREGIKKSWTISRLTSSGLIADRTCDFTDVGTVTLSERVLTPKDLEVNLKLCKDGFRATQFAEGMGSGRNNEQLANAVRSAMLSEIGAQIAQATETTIWHGDKANAGEFDGLITRATGDASVIDVVGTTVTAANVVAEIGKVYAAIPDAILAKPDLNIYVAPNVYRAWQQAIGANHYKDESVVGMKPLNYLGVNLYPTLGMNSSYMFAAEASNIWFGTDMMGDFSEAAVKFIDQSDKDGSNNVHFVGQWAADTNYGFANQIVLYTPA